MISRSLLVAVALAGGLHVTSACSLAQEHGSPGTAPRPPYLQRGDEVETRYRAYRERLEQFFENFGARLETETPDLLAKLRQAPPTPVPYGYGILPKLVPDAPRPSGASRIASGSYSWRRTEGFIDGDIRRLVKLETRLGETGEMVGEDRQREWQKMVDDYRALVANQKLIASHIEYNRLWQKEIARNRSGYDAQTALHDAVLARQAFLEALPTGDQVLASDLRTQAQALSRQIDEATQRLSPPDFLRVEHPTPHHWIMRVPMYTDIEDAAFLGAFQSAVENAWHVHDRGDEFSVALEIRHVSASRLYPDGAHPARGEHIDMTRHINRFPSGAAVLTTGSNSTYVLGRSIDIGPHDIAPNVLAHEFGHILGFADGYFRGYRDRGAEGFEVLEVVIDQNDIMSAPGTGHTSRRLFERLLDATRGRAP